ncbi:type IV secretory system conjugative DNA transfer family protein [Sphingobacterium phlebotomi]|nr:type IV secretory system conjugative DNA transfer family protein [Sphingobacterium phlebotomi]
MGTIIKYGFYLFAFMIVLSCLLVNVFGLMAPFVNGEETVPVMGLNIPLSNANSTLNDNIWIFLFSASIWLLAFGFGVFKQRNALTGLIILMIVFGIADYISKNVPDSKEYIHYSFVGLAGLSGLYRVIKDRRPKPKKIPFAKGESKENHTLTFETEKGKIHLDNPFRGIYVQGGAGSGKSKSIFEPIINQLANKGFCGILYDFKSPELTNKARSVYLGKNIKFANLDFKNPDLSDRCNPISPKYITKSGVAMEFSQTLVNNLIPTSIKNDDFWSQNARMILSGVIWYLREEAPQYCTLPHVISLLLHNDIKEVVDTVSKNPESAGMVASLRQSLEREAHNQTSGIISTIFTTLSRLNTKDIFWLLSADDINLDLNNKENPTFLAIGNDSTLPQTYSPVISLICNSALRQMNEADKCHSVVLLDEAPTLYIPNIEQIPATARSNKIATVFGVQDYSQLVDKYGKDKAEVLLSNLGNQFFGRTTNENTASKIVNLYSKEDRTFETRSKGTGTNGTLIHFGSNTNKGKNESVQERNRVKVTDLINLSAGEFYGIIAEGTPKEFLKTKFKSYELESYSISKGTLESEKMSVNYERIVSEAKSILEIYG